MTQVVDPDLGLAELVAGEHSAFTLAWTDENVRSVHSWLANLSRRTPAQIVAIANPDWQSKNCGTATAIGPSLIKLAAGLRHLKTFMKDHRLALNVQVVLDDFPTDERECSAKFTRGMLTSKPLFEDAMYRAEPALRRCTTLSRLSDHLGLRQLEGTRLRGRAHPALLSLAKVHTVAKKSPLALIVVPHVSWVNVAHISDSACPPVVSLY